MIIEYVNKAVARAEYKKLDDGTWFASIPDFDGVWANGTTVEGCRRELVEVMEEWLILKFKDIDPIPIIDGIDLNIKEAAVA